MKVLARLTCAGYVQDRNVSEGGAFGLSCRQNSAFHESKPWERSGKTEDLRGGTYAATQSCGGKAAVARSTTAARSTAAQHGDESRQAPRIPSVNVRRDIQ